MSTSDLEPRESSVNSSDSTRDNKLEQCPVFPSIPGKDGRVGKELEGQIEKEKKKKHNRKKNIESTNVAEALQPGKIMNPGGSEESNVKGQTDYGGQKQDVRPKSGNRRGQPNRDQRGQGQMPQNPTSQGQGQSPLGQYRQNSGNQGQYQQGRNTPGGRGGNSTPRDNQRGQRCKQTCRGQQNRQACFEPYISAEDLSSGLKLGQLIQGPIRINPKNYEDAYIPHPDGVSDIFISGMKDRNRALNGDVVAVFLNSRENWKIHMNNLKDLEEKHKEQTTSKTVDSVTKSEQTVDSDSDSDVIIESEEIIDLTGDSQSINSKTGEQHNIDQSSNDLPICDNQGNVSGLSGKVENLSNRLENVAIDSYSHKKDNSHNKSRQQQQQKRNDQERTREANKGRNSPASAQKKYSTLQEVLQDGSSVVKNLFTTDDKEKANSANRILQRTGKVVAIIERKHSRASTGHIALMNDKNPNTALFKPLDHRLPRIMIPMDNCPKDFLQRPEDHVNTLFICRIKEWPENSMYAHGELMRSLGEAGEIEPETEGILIENDVDYSEFTEEALSSLPVHELPWQIPNDEIVNRRDLRQHCIFTIDPATARDLDDALSCEKLDDGTYNVGVHIADVSYFLKEYTALDKTARFRATSVYLVQKVIPMLPRILCEQLCSLNPDQDRLTFSVMWNMSETGEIYGEWFGRTVIRSCVKLSYDHAQGFIGEPEREWTEDELPPISDGYSISQIRDTVLNLQKIAKNLRKNRFEGGALRLDQVKLQFTLDKDTGMPNGYKVYTQRDSNRLVEEFMLLANMAVAHKIKNHYPETSFLRRHPPPQAKMVEDLVELCQNLGFPLDPSSAGTLQSSLWRYAGNDEFTMARMQVLVSMCSKPMQNAKYFCTGCIEDEELYRHYALNVPLYTHFTSPIRRYADVMVHRALAAALEYCPPSNRSKIEIQGIADNCNDRKTNSKRVQDLSAELYFSVFVKTAGPFEERGMVMGVLDKAFDVFIMKFGVIKRVYCDKLAIKDKLHTKEQKNPILTLYWESTPEVPQGPVQKISIFTIVTCVLKAGELPLQWMAIIKPPKE